LLSCYLKKPNKNTRLKLLPTLERFAFVALLISSRYLVPFWDLNVFAIQVSKGKLNVSDVEKELNKKIDEVLKGKDFLSDLIKKFASEGFYEWRGIKYFLYEYDLFLKGASKTKKVKINWLEFVKEQEDFVTVEHIYPQTPKEDCWKTPFNVYGIKERRILNNSLGNLLPLSKPKNSSLQNKCFLQKIDNDTNQIGYRYGSYSENEVSKLTEWTPKEILERGVKLLTFMEERWSITLGDQKQKKRILNLDFLP
jgi:hypothetical protein